MIKHYCDVCAEETAPRDLHVVQIRDYRNTKIPTSRDKVVCVWCKIKVVNLLEG